MRAKATGSSLPPIEPVEAGTYPARLVGAIDIGVQPQPAYKGQEKPPAHEVIFIYELLDEFLKDEDGNDQEDKPRWQSERLKFYGREAEKSKIASRYAALDPTNEHGDNVDPLLGVPVMVTLVHNPRKGEGVWVNVDNVAPMRAKDAAKAPELVNDPILFDMDEPNMEVWERVPAWVKKLITSALNYDGSDLQALVDNAPNKDSGEKYLDKSKGGESDEDDSFDPNQEAPY